MRPMIAAAIAAIATATLYVAFHRLVDPAPPSECRDVWILVDNGYPRPFPRVLCEQ